MVDSPPFDPAQTDGVSFPQLWKNLWKSTVFEGSSV
jgi:hypothetical protein